MGDHQISLPEGYVYVDITDDGRGNSFRCNLSSSEEWYKWVKMFESSACQKFIVKRTRKNVIRYAFGQDLVCQHSALNKSVSADGVRSSRSTGCEASISVKIKHVNRNTWRHDSFLKQDPPLSAIVTYCLEHNHETRCADTLRQLRVTDETRDRFMGYFNDGLSPAMAMSLHQSKILAEEDAVNKLANAAVNPKSGSIYYLHNIWRRDNSVSEIDPPVKLVEKANHCRKSGTSTSTSTVHLRSVKESVEQELSRIALLITSRSSSAISALLPSLQSIKTEDDLIQAGYRCRSALRTQRGGIIKVRPSTARRRVGLAQSGGTGKQSPCKRA